MPLNIDLNTPYIDHEMMECNIAPSINLNGPSSSNFNLSFKDLHGSSSNEEYMEEANMFNCENDFEHGFLILMRTLMLMLYIQMKFMSWKKVICSNTFMLDNF